MLELLYFYLKNIRMKSQLKLKDIKIKILIKIEKKVITPLKINFLVTLKIEKKKKNYLLILIFSNQFFFYNLFCL
jgi:hypothetical protein